MPSQNTQEHGLRNVTFRTLTSDKLLLVGTYFHPEERRRSFRRDVEKNFGYTVSYRVIRLVMTLFVLK